MQIRGFAPRGKRWSSRVEEAGLESARPKGRLIRSTTSTGQFFGIERGIFALPVSVKTAPSANRQGNKVAAPTLKNCSDNLGAGVNQIVQGMCAEISSE